MPPALYCSKREAYSHVIDKSDLATLIGDDRKAHLGTRNLVDILNPSFMRGKGVGRQPYQFHATLGELRLHLCQRHKLRSADWSKIVRMREEDNPVVADEVVEIDWTFAGFGPEVWGNGTQAEAVGDSVSWDRILKSTKL